ncbi:MAG: hypothetical protein Q7J98_03180 [Kiritimatiellia bacterium]|nr:hypothetical protein [Kiritimatiellia bacterium]
MSKTQKHKILFWTIIAISFIISKNLCVGAEQETIAMLDRQVLQLEEIWKAGKTNEYFLKASEIAKRIEKINPNVIMYNEEQAKELLDLWNAGKTNESFAKANEFNKENHSITNNLNNIVAPMLNNLMAKKVNIIDGDNNDLYAMDKLSSYLLSNDKAPIKERRTIALLLCRFLGKIRKELIPNFEPKRVMSNVAPPHDARGGFMFSGMDPAAITNPVVRTQYEAAINENRQNGIMNRRQSELRSLGNEFTTKRIIDYIIKTFRGDIAEMGDKQAVIMDNMIKMFRGDDASIGLLAECIQAANLTDKEKEEVLRKIGVKQPRQGKQQG